MSIDRRWPRHRSKDPPGRLDTVESGPARNATRHGTRRTKRPLRGSGPVGLVDVVAIHTVECTSVYDIGLADRGSDVSGQVPERVSDQGRVAPFVVTVQGVGRSGDGSGDLESVHDLSIGRTGPDL